VVLPVRLVERLVEVLLGKLLDGLVEVEGLEVNLAVVVDVDLERIIEKNFSLFSK